MQVKGVEDELQLDKVEEMSPQQDNDEQEAGSLSKRGEFTCFSLCASLIINPLTLCPLCFLSVRFWISRIGQN